MAVVDARHKNVSSPASGPIFSPANRGSPWVQSLSPDASRRLEGCTSDRPVARAELLTEGIGRPDVPTSSAISEPPPDTAPSPTLRSVLPTSMKMTSISASFCQLPAWFEMQPTCNLNLQADFHLKVYVIPTFATIIH
jgi:hypothetical protein